MRNEKTNYFFDVHMHTFNLSHAGILSFLNRLFLENTLSFNDLLNGNIVQIIMKMIFKRRPAGKIPSILLWIIRYTLFILVILLSPLLIFILLFKSLVLEREKLSRSISNTINVLSIFENDLGRQFRYLELDFISLQADIRAIIDQYSDTNTRSRQNAVAFYEEVSAAFNNLDNSFNISDKNYHKAILTPLIMDFKYKGFEELDKNKVYYNLPPRKSVIDQCVDIYEGIKEYLSMSKLQLLEVYPFLGINPANYELEPCIQLSGSFNARLINGLERHFYYIRHTHQLIHYRAFTGREEEIRIKEELMHMLHDAPVSSGLLEQEDDIPTIKDLINKMDMLYLAGRRNDGLRLIRDDGLFAQNMLVKMMLKYFGEYDHPTLDEFRDNNPFFSQAANAKAPLSFWSVRSFFFSGIKVYPPLGFHPWPANDPQAFTITNFLYQFCEEKGIPITTHCSDGGFKVITGNIETDKDIASPENWKKALQAYQKLSLNFAHFGNQGSYTKKRWGEWTDMILSLILDQRFPHIFADLSDIGIAKGSYASLFKSISKYWKTHQGELLAREINHSNYCARIEGHILFGTDFMMNLFHVRSNLEYLRIFDQSDEFAIDGDPPYIIDKHKLCSQNPERFLFGTMP